MNSQTMNMQTVLQSKTLRIESRQIPSALTLTTLLMQIDYPEYSYYSIGVLCEEADGTTEFRMIHDITRSITEAERIFTAVVEGTVTPCTLEDVLQDMIGLL